MNVTKAAQRWRWLSQGIETIDVRQGIGLLSSVTEGALPHTPAIASIPGPTGDAGPVHKGGGRCCASTFDRHSLIAPDVAPSFYPVLSSFPAWVVPCWAGEATGA
ncbi:hypothetical protein NKJ10_31215, partial [Mesorhizobium sp. M0204]|uniref:hypothetical protein n=1 Tax=Mesorhizobium sp. M0204 TaxID=2956913 RepID=UPI00333D4BD5